MATRKTSQPRVRTAIVPGFRTEPKKKARIRWLAKTYAGGNLTRWLEHAALNAPRRYLK